MKLSGTVLLLFIILFLGPYCAHAQYVLPENFNSLKAEVAKDNGAEEDGQMLIKVIAGAKGAIFKTPSSVTYNLDLDNQYNVPQDGKASCYVTTELGQKVYEDSFNIHIGKRGKRTVKFHIDTKDIGFYKISFRFNLSTYDDTIKRVFGVAPDKINSEVHRPADFYAFWKATRDSLSRIKPQFNIIEERALAVNNKKIYLIEMHSWGNAIVRGWLSVPNRADKTKKIPIKYRLPGYIVTLEPALDDDDFAVFNFNVRGSGNSKSAIDTHGEYNLYNIENKDEYVYRAVYMDCVRGLDFLCSLGPKLGLDTTNIMVDGSSQGGGLAIALAAMDKRVKILTVQVPLYADFRKALEITELDPHSQTPIGMIAQYLKTHPSFTREQLFNVWDYYDPLSFAPDVKCPVLMGIGLLDEFCPPQCSFTMYNKLTNKRNEVWSSPEKTHEVDELYYTYQFLWFQDILRLD
jgi:cephalosporin-C deacetylase